MSEPEVDPVAPRLGASTATGMLAGVTAIAINFVTTPIVLHAVGAETYGLWMTLVSSVSYLSLADAGIASSIGRFVGYHRAVGVRNQVRAFFGTVLVLYGLVLLVVLAGAATVNVLLPLIVKIPTASATGITPAIFYVALSVAIIVWTGGMLSALHAAQLLPTANAIRIITAIVSGGLLLGVAIIGFGLTGLAVATFIGALLGLAITAIVVRWRLPWIRVGMPSRLHAAQIGSYGASMFTIFLASVLNFQTDNLVIAATIGVGAVAAYSVALRVTRSIVLLLHKIPDVMFPFYVGMIGRGETERLQTSFLLTARLELAAASCSCVFLAIAGPSLLSWWVGPANVVAFAAFSLALVMMLVESAVHPAAILAIAAGGERKLAVVSVLEAVTNIVLSIQLAKGLGVTGVILGTVIAHCLFTAWWLPRWAMTRVRVDVRGYIRSVLIPSFVPGLMSLAFGVGFLAILSRWHLPVGPTLAAVAGATVFALTYGFLRRTDDLPAAIRVFNSFLDLHLTMPRTRN